jgi:hypothetical protein
MTDSNPTCKTCKLTKANSDFPKGMTVCKACIADKKKKTKADKEEACKLTPEKEENGSNNKKTSTPTGKNPDEKTASGTCEVDSSKFNKKKDKLVNDFTKMMAGLTLKSNVNGELIEFIHKLTLFSSSVSS